MRFGTLGEVHYGAVEEVAPGIRRVVAENPSKFTYRGTGTYLVGRGDVAVIDPGPQLDSHRDALAAALAGERVVAIAVTHCHSDHSPLAAWLRAETGAPTFASGPHLTPPEPELDELGDSGDHDDGDDEIADGVRVEESIDRDFAPDVAVADGDVLASGGTGADRWTLRAVHTPGHTANHTCFALPERSVLFSGDHVMGWSTTVISPPDGDMATYLDSLRKVAGRSDARYWPTHGPVIDRPAEYVTDLIEHRLERERQIVDQVRAGTAAIGDIVATLYAGVDAGLHKAAARSVLAHLRKLVADGVVGVDGGGRAGLRSRYAPA